MLLFLAHAQCLQAWETWDQRGHLHVKNKQEGCALSHRLPRGPEGRVVLPPGLGPGPGRGNSWHGGRHGTPVLGGGNLKHKVPGKGFDLTLFGATRSLGLHGCSSRFASLDLRVQGSRRRHGSQGMAAIQLTAGLVGHGLGDPLVRTVSVGFCAGFGPGLLPRHLPHSCDSVAILAQVGSVASLPALDRAPATWPTHTSCWKSCSA